MPLSDEEMRLLQQMEQALVSEDPKLVSALRGTAMIRQADPRRALFAAFGVLGGAAIMLLGASNQQTWLGVAGFLIMLGAGHFALSALRGREMSLESVESAQAAPVSERRERRAKKSQQAGPSGGFASRMEQRWLRRSRDEF